MRFNICMWFGEICSCSCLTVLPGSAWVLLNTICKDKMSSLYIFLKKALVDDQEFFLSNILLITMTLFCILRATLQCGSISHLSQLNMIHSTIRILLVMSASTRSTQPNCCAGFPKRLSRWRGRQKSLSMGRKMQSADIWPRDRIHSRHYYYYY